MIGLKAFADMGLIVLLGLLSFNQKGFAEVHYTVKSGDTLYSISKTFSVSIRTLKETNHLNGKAIRPKIDNFETPYYSQRFLRGVRVKELEWPIPTL